VFELAVALLVVWSQLMAFVWTLFSMMFISDMVHGSAKSLVGLQLMLTGAGQLRNKWKLQVHYEQVNRRTKLIAYSIGPTFRITRFRVLEVIQILLPHTDTNSSFDILAFHSLHSSTSAFSSLFSNFG